MPIGPGSLLKVTVPVADVPPSTLVGLKETAVTETGLIVRLAVAEIDPSVATTVCDC
jgi:hypothetical protein